MIHQALLRTLALAFATTALFAGGCKDTSGAGSGAPGTAADPAGTAGAGGGGAQPAVDTRPETTPVAGETPSPTAPPGDDSPAAFVECTTRTTMCTREYNPVCGKLTDGARKSYSNKCVACGDQAVVGYSPGACPETPPT
ncbi:hypothetical protein [Nannocystis bainbridge]|uniref:Kazal-like domain-containing protein n=1 Tax=Nannocystis bainbridge TaxID=2995303 RepID=A0ABT5E1S8_9BACT|nr:hypothetical protein [Nannocystis bainbridge]MDC0719751.1 hypothetical protein [Nannocystis bainbridge]